MNSGWQNLRNDKAINAMSKISLQMGKRHLNGEYQNTSVGESYYSERKSNIIRYQRKIRRGSISLARKCSQACFWPRTICGVEAGKETNSEQTSRNYRRMSLPCVFHKNWNKRRSSCAQKWRHFKIPICLFFFGWHRKALKSNHPSEFGKSLKKGEEHRSGLQEETDEPDSVEQTQEKYDLEAKHDFWSISVSFIHRHHGSERQNCTCLKKARFPSHSNVLRFHMSTHILTLSGEQTRHWTYCRNVKWITTGTFIVFGSNQGNGPLSQFILSNDTPPREYTWSGRRLTKIQATSMSVNIWPQMWSGMLKQAQQKRRHWAEEKAKLAKMLESWKVFITSIQKARNSMNSMKPGKMCERSWNYVWTLQCRVMCETPREYHPQRHLRPTWGNSRWALTGRNS